MSWDDEDVETRKVCLFFIRETEKARLYSTVPPERGQTKDTEIWLPRSQIEHTSKDPSGMHIVTIPEWLADKKGL